MSDPDSSISDFAQVSQAKLDKTDGAVNAESRYNSEFSFTFPFYILETTGEGKSTERSGWWEFT